MTGQNIVIVGLQPWDTTIGSNCKNIAMEMARNNRVLYINSPLDTKSAWQGRHDEKVKYRKKIMKGEEPALQQVQQNLWQYYPRRSIDSINFIRWNWLFDVLNLRNNRRIAKGILEAVKELEFQDFYLFNDNDIFRGQYLPQLLKPLASMYYSRDNLIAVDYWKYHGVRLEPKTMAAYTICTANSSYLAAYCRTFNNLSFDVGQGCELDIYLDPNVNPAPELAHIPGPIIGYTGYITSLRLDEQVLLHLARLPKQYQLVLVGPEDEDFKKSALHQLPNVHFLGSRPPELLPAYVKCFDVCINPQLVNPVTIGNYPRKVDEYLAMGKPVLATDTPAMSLFQEHTYLCSTPEEYARKLKEALRENNPQKRDGGTAFARSHSWENSVAKIYEAYAAAGRKAPAGK